jgi:hypothetical protein
MIIRLISVSDHMQLPAFHDAFRAILGWNGDLGYRIRLHGQEFNSFRRKTQSKTLNEFKLHGQEKWFCTFCNTLHMGSGTFPSWIFRTVVKTITRLSVWAAAALRLPSCAAVRLVTG